MSFLVIICKTFIAPMLEFTVLYNYVNRKNKIKITITTSMARSTAGDFVVFFKVLRYDWRYL